MIDMPANQAAWLIGKSVKPLEVKTAPYTRAGVNEIVVKNGAVAINPVDWFKQAFGDLLFSWIKYPFILGEDVAGEVVEIGKGVTRFKVGDRVLGHAVGMDKRSNKSSEGGFQLYTVLRTNLASPVPISMPYEDACVLPLGLSTASCGLYQKDHLALQYPSLSPKPTGKILLVWGGATSVGSSAIQLAIASGYQVITTCSPHNFARVKRLGAVQAFDYNSPTVIKDIIAAFKDKESAGALAIGDTSLAVCIDIIATVKGRKFVSNASAGPMPKDSISVGHMVNMLSYMALTKFKSTTKRVGTKFIWGSDNMANEVGGLVYNDFLGDALAQGKFAAAPEPLVVGRGLERVQEAFGVSRRGVSAKKVVVSL